MKLFKIKLARLLGSKWSAEEILFRAQLPFLEARFSPYLENVIPYDTAKRYAVFECKLPPDDTIKAFRQRVFQGEWGDFEPKDMKLSTEHYDRGPIKVSVKVGLT